MLNIIQVDVVPLRMLDLPFFAGIALSQVRLSHMSACCATDFLVNIEENSIVSARLNNKGVLYRMATTQGLRELFMALYVV